MHLPPSTAEHVFSGSYVSEANPRDRLAAIVRGLEARSARVSAMALQKSLAVAKKTGAPQARLLAQIAVAEAKGDLELAARLKVTLADETSNGK